MSIMCTLAVCFGVFDRFPLVVAANRDEFYDRPGLPPQVLAEGPAVFGPKDARAGGTWTGINEHGLFAGITNISGISPRDPTRRSRGHLVIEALACRDAYGAAEATRAVAATGVFNPFQLILCDAKELIVVKHIDAPDVTARHEGVHVFSNWDEVPDVAAFKEGLVRRRIAEIPRRAGIGIAATEMIALLSDHAGDEWHRQLCVHTDGYGTMSSMILALGRNLEDSACLCAEGHPCEAAFVDHSTVMRDALGW